MTKNMEGTYKCTAENKAGRVSSTATLRILGKYLKLQQLNKVMIYKKDILIHEERGKQSTLHPCIERNCYTVCYLFQE